MYPVSASVSSLSSHTSSISKQRACPPKLCLSPWMIYCFQNLERCLTPQMPTPGSCLGCCVTATLWCWVPPASPGEMAAVEGSFYCFNGSLLWDKGYKEHGCHVSSCCLRHVGLSTCNENSGCCWSKTLTVPIKYPQDSEPSPEGFYVWTTLRPLTAFLIPQSSWGQKSNASGAAWQRGTGIKQNITAPKPLRCWKRSPHSSAAICCSQCLLNIISSPHWDACRSNEACDACLFHFPLIVTEHSFAVCFDLNQEGGWSC